MKKHVSGFIYTLIIFSITIISWKPASVKNQTISSKAIVEQYISNIYDTAHLQESGLGYAVFKKAVTGFINLKIDNKLSPFSSILTIVDYAKSSCEKRMWVIDLINKELIINTWVAHGQGSGDDLATDFSDRIDSHQSSVGFFITDDVYYGKNGRSLRLDGMDAGFNENARTRAIVLHGADYVCQAVIESKGRLGRSFGCPAVAPEIRDQIIETIKNKTVLFINGDENHYVSKYLDEDIAANYLAPSLNNIILANL